MKSSELYCAVLFLLIVPGIPAQRAEVLMLPLKDGRQSALAVELTQKLQEELGKNGLEILFSEGGTVRPLSSEARLALRESARKKNLAFLLVQDLDAQEADTIRHDLYSTFDGRLLSSILVRGDSGRSALLRPALLAREIVQQLKELPPVVVVNTVYTPLSDELPLIPPPPIQGVNNRPALSLGGGPAGLLGIGDDLGYIALMDVLWKAVFLPFPGSLGLASGWMGHTIRQGLFPLGWDFSFLQIKGNLDFRIGYNLQWGISLGMGAGLLQLHPGGIPPKRKILPEGSAGVFFTAGFGNRFFTRAAGNVYLILNPEKPLAVWSGDLSLGWKL